MASGSNVWRGNKYMAGDLQKLCIVSSRTWRFKDIVVVKWFIPNTASNQDYDPSTNHLSQVVMVDKCWPYSLVSLLVHQDHRGCAWFRLTVVWRKMLCDFNTRFPVLTDSPICTYLDISGARRGSGGGGDQLWDVLSCHSGNTSDIVGSGLINRYILCLL